MDWRDRPETEPVRKVQTPTVIVVATTKPPTPGFRYAGRVVGFGEEVRVPLDFAQDLAQRKKALIVEGSEETVLM